MSIKVVISLKDKSPLNTESDIYEINVMTSDREQAINSATSGFNSTFPEHNDKEIDVECTQQ